MQVEEILEICSAYESGVNAGRMNFSADLNSHEEETTLYYAWAIGHNTGIQTEFIEMDEIYIN
jgi:hypothetical protein